MRLIGKLICAVTRKHKRGKRIKVAGAHDEIECPRCGGRKAAPKSKTQARNNADI